MKVRAFVTVAMLAGSQFDKVFDCFWNCVAEKSYFYATDHFMIDFNIEPNNVCHEIVTFWLYVFFARNFWVDVFCWKNGMIRAGLIFCFLCWYRFGTTVG